LQPSSAFVEIPRDFLSRIATDSERIPRLYYVQFWSVRRFFWMRLRLVFRLMRRLSPGAKNCLDFGGGGGVFLPTLCGAFERVVCIDLETAEARAVRQEFRLENLRLVQDDITIAELPDAPFDVIVAADVLEHFPDLSVPVAALTRWIARDGKLYTSLPTENGLYVALRRVFGVTKPADHYHTGAEVESFLERSGFARVARLHVPLYWGLLPLFFVSAWRLRDAGEP
jgi:2-polyprenyl-3-methyl-5-hydroxy-6-metoxy-1,4-benzoquinol methylase